MEVLREKIRIRKGGGKWAGIIGENVWGELQKLLIGPLWPAAAHRQSACQTNCLGWQSVVETAWSKTLEEGNSCSLLPLGSLQHPPVLTVVWEWQNEVNDLLFYILQELNSSCAHTLQGLFYHHIPAAFTACFLASFFQNIPSRFWVREQHRRKTKKFSA